MLHETRCNPPDRRYPDRPHPESLNMAYDEKTAERVRGVLFGRRDLVEKR
jgi:hypothetical protein